MGELLFEGKKDWLAGNWNWCESLLAVLHVWNLVLSYSSLLRLLDQRPVLSLQLVVFLSYNIVIKFGVIHLLFHFLQFCLVFVAFQFCFQFSDFCLKGFFFVFVAEHLEVFHIDQIEENVGHAFRSGLGLLKVIPVSGHFC